MNTTRPCGCKALRTCLLCERDYNITKDSLMEIYKPMDPWSYCIKCDKLYPGWNAATVNAQHPSHESTCSDFGFPGVYIKENFLTTEEAKNVVSEMDKKTPWKKSQSGRYKQNFGPKTNFKKRKINCEKFYGFPKYTKYIRNRLRMIPLLEDYETIEECSLEYVADRGALIEPHIDDCWVWGERVVTVNCLGDSVLTMTLYDANDGKDEYDDYDDNDDNEDTKYNLHLVKDYKNKLILPYLHKTTLKKLYNHKVIRIPMPSCSLLVLYGPARYQFEHAVLREDIMERRVCIAFREFTPFYWPIIGIEAEIGDSVRQRAKLILVMDDAKTNDGETNDGETNDAKTNDAA